jgi:hypothetical protein
MDWTYAKKLTEPIVDGYHNVYDASIEILSGYLTPREGYDLIL